MDDKIVTDVNGNIVKVKNVLDRVNGTVTTATIQESASLNESNAINELRIIINENNIVSETVLPAGAHISRILIKKNNSFGPACRLFIKDIDTFSSYIRQIYDKDITEWYINEIDYTLMSDSNLYFILENATLVGEYIATINYSINQLS